MSFDIGKLTSLHLGYVGENDAREIDIDAADWLESFPDAGLGIMVRRPNEADLYPAEVTRDGTHIIWRPKRSDVEIDGEGEAQIILTDDADRVMRSRIVKTVIKPSMAGTVGEAPETYKPWVDHAIKAAADADKSAAESAESAASSAASAAASEESRQDAKASEDAAKNSADVAAQSQQAAKTSEDAAAQSAREAEAVLPAIKETAAQKTEEAVQAIKAQETASVNAVSAQEVESVKAVEDAAIPAAENAAAAAKSAEDAEASADRAEMAASNAGWIDMAVNADEHLIFTRTESADEINFELQEGRLHVIYG